jgi:hypothetical protein
VTANHAEGLISKILWAGFTVAEMKTIKFYSAVCNVLKIRRLANRAKNLTATNAK